MANVGLIFAVLILIVGIAFVMLRVRLAQKAKKPALVAAPIRAVAAELRPTAQAPDLGRVPSDELFKEFATRIKEEAENIRMNTVLGEARSMMIGRLSPVPASFTATANPNPAAVPPAPIPNPVAPPPPAAP